MKGKETALPSGVYAAFVTARKQRTTEADVGSMLDYIGHLESAGINGLVLFGSTGEFVHFDATERMRVASLALRRARVPMLVNVSHSDLAGAAALAEHAIGSGAKGILLMPPYFYAYDDASVEAFYSEILDLFAPQTRIYLYNLPQCTHPLSAGLMSRLLSTGRFAGIKDSSGDPALFESVQNLRKSHDFAHMAGNERLYPIARLRGADGIVSGVAAALPELITTWDRALTANDAALAEACTARVMEYLDWLDRFPPTFLIRQTAALRGWVDAQPSLPPSPRQQHDLERFQAWYRDWFPALPH